MSNPDIEMADVQITLKNGWQSRQGEAIKQLESAGMQILGSNEAETELEGVIAVDKLPSLKKLECVAYVRTLFKYEDEDDDEPDPDGDANAFEPL
jgi:hypothetical protein